jgi:hypothetical protein
MNDIEVMFSKSKDMQKVREEYLKEISNMAQGYRDF